MRGSCTQSAHFVRAPSAETYPSPAFATLRHPLPQGERGSMLRPLLQHRPEIRPRTLRLGARGVGCIDEAEIAVNQPLARMILHVHAGIDQRVRVQRALVA